MRRQDLLTHLAGLILTATRDHPVRVAVDGPDTAGKTTLADELAVALSAVYLHIDESEMLRRGVLRDHARHGGPEAARRQFETQYIPRWRTYQTQHNPAAAATLTIDHQDPTHPKIRHRTA